MVKKYKIPIKEAVGQNQLNGTYKVSFDINIAPEDNIFVTDIIQSIAEVFDINTVQKIAHIDLEKIGIENNHKLKVGDLVQLVENIQLEVEILENDGYYIIGKQKETTRSLGKTIVELPKNATAYVNKVGKDEVELIDFDCTIIVPLVDEETDEVENTYVNIEQITLPLYQVEKVEEK